MTRAATKRKAVKKAKPDVVIPESLRKPVARVDRKPCCEYCGAERGSMHHVTCPLQAQAWSPGAAGIGPGAGYLIRGLPTEIAEPTTPIASHRIDKAVTPYDSRFGMGVAFGVAIGLLIGFIAAAKYFS